MKKNVFVQYFFLSLITLGVIIGFIYLFQNYHASLTKAQDNSLTLKIKLQGERYPQATTKTKVVLYNAQGKVKEFNDITFAYQTDKTFDGSITFDPGFDYNALYAIFIKPNNYFGQLFCSETINGKNCTSPQFIFKQNTNSIDLSKQIFFGGDISPANGKVDSYDISKIMSNLGTSNDPSTDINNDDITNSIDYMLALYSLSQNFSDDAITLVVIPATLSPTNNITVTITASPSPTIPFVANTPVPTTVPSPTISSATNTPIPTNTIAPTPTQGPIGICHTIPGSMAKSICGVPEQDVAASSAFGPCAGTQSSNPLCTGTTSKGKCTCPNGKVCTCQLQDTATQTIECTNGGKMEITQCN